MQKLWTKYALSCLTLSILLLIACQNKNEQLSRAENNAVKDSVTQMADNIAKDITTKGPAAWLNYFEDNPGFFMASGGALAFKDYKSGKAFTLDTVAKMFSKIDLSWNNYKIDPLTAEYASFGAAFHEDIVLTGGKAMSIDGYVTALAHFDGKGWKLRNMNWAIRAPVDARY